MIGEVIHGIWKAWRAVKDAPSSAAIARTRLLEVLEDDHRRLDPNYGQILVSDGAPLKEWVSFDISAVAAASVTRYNSEFNVPIVRAGNADCCCDLYHEAMVMLRAETPYIDPWRDGRWSFECYNLSLIHKPMRKVYRWVFP